MTAEWATGWRLLVAAFLGAVLTAIPMNLIGVFMPHLSGEFGWSHGAISAAVPMVGWTIGLAAPIMGRLMDRHGARPFGIAGAVLLPLAMASLAFAGPSIWSFWLCWAGIAAAQVFCGIMTWTVPVARHFERNRGAALAVVILGNSVAGMVYAPTIRVVIDAWGWRMAYFATGAATLALFLPIMLAWFREQPGPAAGSRPRGQRDAAAEAPAAVEMPGIPLSQAARTRQFWQLLLAVVLSGGAAIGLFVHIAPIAISMGMGPVTAAAAVSMISLGSTCAKFGIGLSIDRVRAAPIAAMTMSGPVVCCLVLLYVQPLPSAGLLAAAMLIGLASGAELDVLGVIIGRYFGMRHFGQIYGVVLGSYQAAIGTGPLLLGLAYDASGNYRSSLAGCVAVLALSAVLYLTMGREKYTHDRRDRAGTGAGLQDGADPEGGAGQDGVRAADWRARIRARRR